MSVVQQMLLSSPNIWIAGDNIQYSDATGISNSASLVWTTIWSFSTALPGMIRIKYRYFGADSTGFRSVNTRILIDGIQCFTAGESNASKHFVSFDIGGFTATQASNSGAITYTNQFLPLNAGSVVTIQGGVQNAAQLSYITASIDSLTVCTLQPTITPSPFTGIVVR